MTAYPSLMNLIFHPYELQLKHTFTISRESHNTQPSLVVELQADGISGYGEATSNPYYNITIENMRLQLEKIKPKLLEMPVSAPEQFWQTFEPHLKDNYFALCALDMAYNDWYARKKQQKLFELWKLNTANNPLTNYTIGIDSIEKMIAKLREKPWPIYKIKLGTKNDLDIIHALRKETDAVFRVDANCGWTAAQTIENAKELKKLGVEFIEQPLRADDWEGAKEVYQHSVLPIIADESCIVEADIDKCLGFFHGVNVKLTKCGGLTPGKRMLEKARKLGMKTMVGCMTESSVGISAIAQLLPLLDYVDMDGALLLKEDIAKGVDIIHGQVFYSNIAGTGVTLF